MKLFRFLSDRLPSRIRAVHVATPVARGILLCAIVCLSSGPSWAQGLLWNLPEDKTLVRYEGTLTHKEFRSNINEDRLLTPEPWIHEMTIKSVGKVTEMIEGRPTPCRWIEIKVVTGRAIEGGIDPGPAGASIYKVLIPENKVIGDVVDGDRIPVVMIPIVRGWRKVGDEAAKPLQSKVLQVYPTITLLQHYRELTPDGAGEEIMVGQTSIKSEKFKGTQIYESPTGRSTNNGELWRSKEMPFGLVKWTVKETRESKDADGVRSTFKPVSESTVTMTAREIRNDAESELQTP